MTTNTTPATTAPTWVRDYRDLTGLRVELLVDRRYGHMEGPEWVLDGVIPAGTVGEAHHGDNAGFRGMEWWFYAADGRRVSGVPGCYLRTA